MGGPSWRFMRPAWAAIVRPFAFRRGARIWLRQWAVSSAVERLVYTELAGGSIPSPPIPDIHRPASLTHHCCRPKRCALSLRV